MKINRAVQAVPYFPINNPTVATIEFAAEGQQIGRSAGGVAATIGSVDIRTGKSPGATFQQGDGRIAIYVLSPGQDAGQLPGQMMSNGAPGQVDSGLALWHELGHTRGIMKGRIGDQTKEDGNTLENTIRRLRDPKAPIRIEHDLKRGTH